MTDMPVELGVLLFGDGGPGPRPQGRSLVDLTRFAAGGDPDRQSDMPGIGLDDGLQTMPVGKLLRVLLQLQGNGGAARRVGRRFGHVETRPAVRYPGPGFPGSGLPGRDRDRAGDHEDGIEPDAELADHADVGAFLLRLFLLGFGQLLGELRGARTGDGAEIGDQFVPAHADAVVGDRDQRLLVVERDGDCEVGIVPHQRIVELGLVAQSVAGIRRVGDQFPQEDLAPRIERVDDNIEDAVDLGLKLVMGAGLRFGHVGCLTLALA